jgi:hypothetical protein
VARFGHAKVETKGQIQAQTDETRESGLFTDRAGRGSQSNWDEVETPLVILVPPNPSGYRKGRGVLDR